MTDYSEIPGYRKIYKIQGFGLITGLVAQLFMPNTNQRMIDAIKSLEKSNERTEADNAVLIKKYKLKDDVYIQGKYQEIENKLQFEIQKFSTKYPNIKIDCKTVYIVYNVYNRTTDTHVITLIELINKLQKEILFEWNNHDKWFNSVEIEKKNIYD